MNWENRRPEPRLNPLPEKTEYLDHPQMSLNGEEWKLNRDPPKDLRILNQDSAGWEEVSVPSQVEGEDGSYAYMRTIFIPEEWEGNRIFLRFDGANCYARVFLDGKYAGDHYGGFVSWDCELTGLVIPGKSHLLVVGTEDRPDEVNPFHRGGLIRDVILYALPRICLSRLHVETKFDEWYEDAELIVSGMISGGKGMIELSLVDPEGRKIKLGSISGQPDCCLRQEYMVSMPKKWDSEHPSLYTLHAVLTAEDGSREEVVRRFGFRQIERRGNEVYINGNRLKLRGINRHDIHPLTGRALTHELVERDVQLLKEANINFVRTSHYPPRPDFLDLCDQYGIYVEDEIAVSFVHGGIENDPACEPYFMGQFAEMIERDRSHPCVVIWSLANESHWGENHAKMNAYAHKEDPSRLTIFSFPMTQMDDDDPVDIWSTHYDRWDRNLSELSECFRRSFREPGPFPVFHDESIHIPCYDIRELRRDPGVRDFWGETISRFWSRIWDTKGVLGCAVWAGIDDIRVQDGRQSGLEWGIIDGWRRLKPEYWHIRKGYSPIHIIGEPYVASTGEIGIQLENRFNHTKLSEVLIRWRLGKKYGECNGPDIGPGKKGQLLIPVLLTEKQTLELDFIDPQGYHVEEACYPLGKKEIEVLSLSKGIPPEIIRENEKIKICGKDFLLMFSEKTGLIEEGRYQGRLVLTGGPYLNLNGLCLGPWELENMDVMQEESCARITLSGGYDNVKVRFLIRVDTKGLMETECRIMDMPYPSPRQVAISASITSHAGGYSEVGITYRVVKEMEELSWKRQGVWNVYPDWHIGRLRGTAEKHNREGRNPVDRDPGWDWKMDEMDWGVFGKYEIGHRGTRDFSSTKASVYQARLGGEKAGFTAVSDGTAAVRMEISHNPENIVSDRDARVQYFGKYLIRRNRFHSLNGTETWLTKTGDICEYTFIGTGIVWITSRDNICGVAKVFIDGRLADTIDLGLSKTEKNPREYQRLYRELVFSVEGLTFGEHCIRIEATGEKAEGSSACYVPIDYFLVLNGEEEGDTLFHINCEFNYPELAWGDYIKPPIKVQTGYVCRVYTKLTD